MFDNFKVVAHMRTPIAAIDPIVLDSIILAAIAKEELADEYYSGTNEYWDKDKIKSVLGPILDKKYGVYCTSAATGSHREHVGKWTKRWDSVNDDIVNLGNKNKPRINIASGAFKNYHIPVVLKSYTKAVFYVRGDMAEVGRLLAENITYIGKKGSQGYGLINKWELFKIEEDHSLIKDNKPMRPIPVKECGELLYQKDAEEIITRPYPTIPPYWRNNHIEACVMPEEW